MRRPGRKFRATGLLSDSTFARKAGQVFRGRSVSGISDSKFQISDFRFESAIRNPQFRHARAEPGARDSWRGTHRIHARGMVAGYGRCEKREAVKRRVGLNG